MLRPQLLFAVAGHQGSPQLSAPAGLMTTTVVIPDVHHFAMANDDWCLEPGSNCQLPSHKHQTGGNFYGDS